MSGLILLYISNITLSGSGIGQSFINFGSAYYGLMFDDTFGISVSGFTMWNSPNYAFTNFNQGLKLNLQIRFQILCLDPR